MDKTAALKDVARSLASVGVPESRQEDFLREVTFQAGNVPLPNLNLKQRLDIPSTATREDSPLTFVARDLRTETIEKKEQLTALIAELEKNFSEAPVLRRQLKLVKEILASHSENSRTSPTSPVTTIAGLASLDDSDLDETKLKSIIHAHLLCTEEARFRQYFDEVLIPKMTDCQTPEEVYPAFYSLLSSSKESARNIVDLMKEYANHGLIHPKSLAYRLVYFETSLIPISIIHLNKTPGALSVTQWARLEKLPAIAARDRAYEEKATALNKIFQELRKWNDIFTKSHRLVRYLEQRAPRHLPETL